MTKLRRAYYQHSHNAKLRGIEFLITFNEWLTVWRASGRLKRRGNKPGYYVMARFRDKGPYAINNVKIILWEENQREASEAWVGRKHSLSSKIAISKTKKDWWANPDNRARMARAHSGHSHSAETKRKLSKAASKQWAEGRGHS